MRQDHIHSPPLANEWPAHTFRSILFTAQVILVQKVVSWALVGSTSILVQRPEQSVRPLISLHFPSASLPGAPARRVIHIA